MAIARKVGEVPILLILPIGYLMLDRLLLASAPVLFSTKVFAGRYQVDPNDPYISHSWWIPASFVVLMLLAAWVTTSLLNKRRANDLRALCESLGATYSQEGQWGSVLGQIRGREFRVEPAGYKTEATSIVFPCRNIAFPLPISGHLSHKAFPERVIQVVEGIQSEANVLSAKSRRLIESGVLTILPDCVSWERKGFTESRDLHAILITLSAVATELERPQPAKFK